MGGIADGRQPVGAAGMGANARMAGGFGLQRTRQAMTIVGISEDDQDAVFRTVAAVLHLGNVAFQEGADADASQVRTACWVGWGQQAVLCGGG